MQLNASHSHAQLNLLNHYVQPSYPTIPSYGPPPFNDDPSPLRLTPHHYLPPPQAPHGYPQASVFNLPAHSAHQHQMFRANLPSYPHDHLTSDPLLHYPQPHPIPPRSHCVYPPTVTALSYGKLPAMAAHEVQPGGHHYAKLPAPPAQAQYVSLPDDASKPRYLNIASSQRGHHVGWRCKGVRDIMYGEGHPRMNRYRGKKQRKMNQALPLVNVPAYPSDYDYHPLPTVMASGPVGCCSTSGVPQSLVEHQPSSPPDQDQMYQNASPTPPTIGFTPFHIDDIKAPLLCRSTSSVESVSPLTRPHSAPPVLASSSRLPPRLAEQRERVVSQNLAKIVAKAVLRAPALATPKEGCQPLVGDGASGTKWLSTRRYRVNGRFTNVLGRVEFRSSTRPLREAAAGMSPKGRNVHTSQTLPTIITDSFLPCGANRPTIIVSGGTMIAPGRGSKTGCGRSGGGSEGSSFGQPSNPFPDRSTRGGEHHQRTIKRHGSHRFTKKEAVMDEDCVEAMPFEQIMPDGRKKQKQRGSQRPLQRR